MNQPAKSYIICATPRSGSTMVCDLLAATNVAGHPASFYRRQSTTYYGEKLGIAIGPIGDPGFERSFLNAIMREGTGSTGTFGLRLMWETAKELSWRLSQIYPNAVDDRARYAAAFGSPVYIHLSRLDKLAQAISRLTAEQSGLWHMNADGTERERNAPKRVPEYDGTKVAGFLSDLESDDKAWQDWFSEQGIEPISIAYETFSAGPKATLATLLNGLGQNPALADTVEVRTARLADARSQQWADRFRSEKR